MGRYIPIFLALFLQTATPPSCCDLNGDGVVNVADVQIEINAALGVGTGGILPVADAPTAGPPFTLSHAPVSSPGPMVFVNGILQMPSRDYQITGQALTFTAADLGETPAIQVIYWYAAPGNSGNRRGGHASGGIAHRPVRKEGLIQWGRR